MASNTKATGVKNAAESVYSTSELVANYKLFGVNRDIVALALRKAGKQEATFTEAKAIIDKFKTKEVK